ncbi:MAG: putative toxin-antitoxin system toxin component, PIN family [Oscillospiraceae bacterium]|nr:putative toxin-antitoxin system toxin component, PIN family [Oscillospiraceae bacterium]
MKYYAVIDTNVLVSAMLKWNSVPGSIMQLVFDGIVVPIVNEEIIDEYKEVLLRPKFKLNYGIVERLLYRISEAGFYLVGERIDIELPDEDDRVFYEVVMKSRKDEDSYLVTGNLKHFPAEPFVVTPRQMLDIIFTDNND